MEKIQTTIQIGRGNLFIAASGIGGDVAANQAHAVQTKVETKNRKQFQSEDCEKTNLKDTTSNKEKRIRNRIWKKGRKRSSERQRKKVKLRQKSQKILI